MKLLGQPVSPLNEMLSWSTYEQPFTPVALSYRSLDLCPICQLFPVVLSPLHSFSFPFTVAFLIPIGGTAKHKPALYCIVASITSQQESLADPISVLKINWVLLNAVLKMLIKL